MELNFILFICRQSTVMIIPLLLNELIFGNIWGTLLSLIFLYFSSLVLPLNPYHGSSPISI